MKGAWPHFSHHRATWRRVPRRPRAGRRPEAVLGAAGGGGLPEVASGAAAARRGAALARINSTRHAPPRPAPPARAPRTDNPEF